MMRHTLIAAFLFTTVAAAQQVQTTPPKPTLRELTIENIFDPKHRVFFSGAPQGGFVWLDDKTFTWPRTNEKGEIVEQAVIDTESGKKRVLFDAAKLQATARKRASAPTAASSLLSATTMFMLSTPPHSVNASSPLTAMKTSSMEFSIGFIRRRSTDAETSAATGGVRTHRTSPTYSSTNGR